MDIKQYIDRLLFLERLERNMSTYSPLYTDILNVLCKRSSHRLAYASMDPAQVYHAQQTSLNGTFNSGYKQIEFELMPLMALMFEVLPRPELSELLSYINSQTRHVAYNKEIMGKHTGCRITRNGTRSGTPFVVVTIDEIEMLPHLIQEFSIRYHERHRGPSASNFIFLEFSDSQVHNYMVGCFAEFYEKIQQAMFKREMYRELLNESDEYLEELKNTEGCTVPHSVFQQLEMDNDGYRKQDRRYIEGRPDMGVHHQHFQRFVHSGHSY